MHFTGFPEYKNHPREPSRFIVTSGFTVFDGDERLEVKAGVIVNGASVPAIFSLIIPRWHPHYNRPAAMHDALVGEFGQPKAMVTNDDGVMYELTWKESAVWLRTAMEAEGAPPFKRWLFYHSVMRYKDVQRFLNRA
jgi:hypothetical protein